METIVIKIPELKSSKLVKIQIQLYVDNNKIKRIKRKKDKYKSLEMVIVFWKVRRKQKMLEINSDIEGFGNLMILALRYSLGRRTYVTLEVSDFIKKNKDLITERVCTVMIRDINQYMKDHNSGFIKDDDCDYNNWVSLYNLLYDIARERNYTLIGVL